MAHKVIIQSLFTDADSGYVDTDDPIPLKMPISCLQHFNDQQAFILQYIGNLYTYS